MTIFGSLWFATTYRKGEDRGASASKEGPSESAISSTQSSASQRPPRIPHLISSLTDPQLYMADQIEALHALPADLSEKELAALVDLLTQSPPIHIRSGDWLTLMNEVMVILRDPKFNFTQYPTAIGGILNDRHLDPMIRDYAAQHLALYLDQNRQNLDSEALAVGVGQLLAVLHDQRETSEPIAGTSLLALCDFYERTPPESDLLVGERQALNGIIEQLVSGDRSAGMPLQISAIQAAGRLRIAEALPSIRRYAAGDHNDRMLQVSSIAALGSFGSPEDEALLSELSTGETKFRFAAQAALAALRTQTLN